MTTARQLTALADTCEQAADEQTLFVAASERLRRLVPFDGAAWFATDPATVLATSPVRIENVESGHCETYWDRECNVEDALLFRDLARSEAGLGTLYETTGQQPTRSARYREFLAPQGYGDELRAALRAGQSTWGLLDLFRQQGRPAFNTHDVAIVRSVMPVIGSALRRFSNAGRFAAGRNVEAPGTALMSERGQIVSLDASAEAMFEELAGPGWASLPAPMTPVYAAVAQAVAIKDGRAQGPASARLRALTSGRWLVIHASCLRGTDGGAGMTALTIEPAKSAQIAPIIVEAYCLTTREQEITRCVARGLSNPEIAAELFLSPHTVRDHLKAVFAKVGVSSRGELVAKLFAEHYGPALHDPEAVVQHVEVM